MRKPKREYFLWGVTVVTIVTSLLCPSYLLNQKISQGLNRVKVSDLEYGLNQVVSSEDYQFYYSLLMVNGDWKAKKTEVSFSNVNMYEKERLLLKWYQQLLFHLYEQQFYPVEKENSDYAWYSYDIHLYEYQDEVFYKYSALVWDITYYKFDKSEEHHIVVDAKSGELYSMRVSLQGKNMNKEKQAMIINQYADRNHISDFLKLIEQRISLIELWETMDEKEFMEDEYESYYSSSDENTMQYDVVIKPYPNSEYALVDVYMEIFPNQQDVINYDVNKEKEEGWYAIKKQGMETSCDLHITVDDTSFTIEKTARYNSE